MSSNMEEPSYREAEESVIADFYAEARKNRGSEPDKSTDEDETAMAVAGSIGGVYNQPIHESITLSALMSVDGSGVSSTRSLKSATNEDWEFVRGVIWNDDPAGLLFDDTPSENHSYAWGLQWWNEYRNAKSQWDQPLDGERWRNPIGRSHYGDLQFLHCMASNLGESPHETKRKVMIWMEVMYKLSNGEDGITPDTRPKDTKLDQLLSPPAGTMGGSLPPRFQPISYMLAPKSTYSKLDIRRRALGSMFHVIQDSFAIGHTRRVPRNSEDITSHNPLTFRPGVTDRWGPIKNFHTYHGQDDHQHAHYDHGSDGVPNPSDLRDLDQWDQLIGCRDAVDRCIGLARLRFSGASWDGQGGVREYLDGVFEIAENATPANSEVN